MSLTSSTEQAAYVQGRCSDCKAPLVMFLGYLVHLVLCVPTLRRRPR